MDEGECVAGRREEGGVGGTVRGRRGEEGEGGEGAGFAYGFYGQGQRSHSIFEKARKQ